MNGGWKIEQNELSKGTGINSNLGVIFLSFPFKKITFKQLLLSTVFKDKTLFTHFS